MTDENIIKDDDTTTILNNLSKYTFIAKYLGSIIRQRLNIVCFRYGALTANLLENNDANLERLNTILNFGEKRCENFRHIFSGRSLPKSPQSADAQVVDILSEVKAFEFLMDSGFCDIANVRRTSAKTVDFTANKEGLDYAIEVTRLGISISTEKQPVYNYAMSTLTFEECENASGFEVGIMFEGSNVERLIKEISDAIDRKFTQLREFISRQKGYRKGLIFISSGRDYFVGRRYENKSYEMIPTSDFLSALKEVWQFIIAEKRNRYLHHIVLTRGKDLRHAIICPVL